MAFNFTNPTTFMIMVFYSFLTYFLFPQITLMVLGYKTENCVIGFSFGFAVSVFLWLTYGKEYVN